MSTFGQVGRTNVRHLADPLSVMTLLAAFAAFLARSAVKCELRKDEP